MMHAAIPTECAADELGVAGIDTAAAPQTVNRKGQSAAIDVYAGIGAAATRGVDTMSCHAR